MGGIRRNGLKQLNCNQKCFVCEAVSLMESISLVLYVYPIFTMTLGRGVAAIINSQFDRQKDIDKTAPSWNQFCSGKAVSITYCVCVCVCSLRRPACNAHAPCYIDICVMSGSRIYIFVYFLISGEIF